MAGRLEGKVAIVTGAAGYLGMAHSVHMAREGARVVVTDIIDGQKTVDAVTEAGGEAIFQRVDVTSWDDVQRMADDTRAEYGRIDILVNNAALVANIQKPWTEFTPDEWDRNLAVDLKGMFMCARAVYPTMQQQRSGRIVNISSGTMMIGMPNFLPYVSAKAGVIGFTRSLATELGTDNITVNAILVGLFPHEIAGLDNMEAMTEMVMGMQALKRVGQPDDLSPTVAFLASDDAGWITGQAIAVDGGLVRSGG
ncbi:SDR family oxidoreductase [Aeromicrobium sp.]|uniref:SDR family NAD(P)-dependent oxidoreductase n=1 Tax=Aeromicrobium sp. TaxID=1871063 RepID=UPI0025B8DD62|nr:SDR family oxidoreductase [Aeromicrobium sp.]